MMAGSFHESFDELKNRYRIISELITDYAYSFSVHPDGTLSLDWITGTIERITGFSPEESEVRGGWIKLIHPEDQPIAEKRATKLMRGEKDISELRIITKENEIRWLRDYGVPEYSEGEGRVIRIIGAAQDITENIAANNALLASEERFRLLFENHIDALVIADETGQYVLANDRACELFGYSREEILQMKTSDIIVPENTSSAAQRYATYLEKGFMTGDSQYIHPDSSTRTVSYAAMRISEKLHAAVFHDITEKVEAELALKKAHEELEERVEERTEQLQVLVDAMSGREIRMMELKKVIKELRAQIVGLGAEPIANDPLNIDS